MMLTVCVCGGEFGVGGRVAVARGAVAGKHPLSVDVLCQGNGAKIADSPRY